MGLPDGLRPYTIKKGRMPEFWRSFLRFIFGIVFGIRELFYHPMKIAVVCLALGLGALTFDGTLLRLWSLNKDQKDMYLRIDAKKQEIAVANSRLQDSQRLEFIEKQARNQLDLVKDGDLVFIFADNAAQEIQSVR
jgi:cell division protein FtsB